jgi:hypothetical protein
MGSKAEAYRDQGFDVYERGGSLVLDVPNPRVTDDDYFHGANPHTEGFGSHGLGMEGGGNDLEVRPGDARTGEATADVQNRNEDNAGWNKQAGAVAGQDGGGAAGSGEPDESWTNARIREYADRNNVDTSGANTKAELLSAVREGRGGEGSGQGDGQE